MSRGSARAPQKGVIPRPCPPSARRALADLLEHTAPPTRLYTRDVSRRGLGFITRTALPLGHGGILELTAPDGSVLNLHCTLLRCRASVQEWYEGTLHFNRDQPEFDCE